MLITRHEANANLIYYKLIEERLDQFVKPAMTLDDASALLEKITPRSIQETERLFNKKMQEIELKIEAWGEKTNQELHLLGEPSFRTKQDNGAAPTFTLLKWNELYLNQLVKSLLEKFAIKNRGKIYSQGLDHQTQLHFCHKITHLVIRLMQKEFPSKAVPSVDPSLKNREIQCLLLESYDEEVMRLTKQLIKLKLKEQRTSVDCRSLREEILNQIQVQFPEHDQSLPKYYLLKNLPIHLKALNVDKRSPEQTLKNLVRDHLDPYIGSLPIPGQRLEFLENCRTVFMKEHPSETFSEKKLLTIYLSYLIDRMHERYAFTRFGTMQLNPTTPPERELHCKKLLKALQDALKNDFKETPFLIPSASHLEEKINLSLKTLDAQGISLLAERLLNIKFRELKDLLLEKPEESLADDLELLLIDHIMREINTLFPSFEENEIKELLPSTLPDKLTALKLAIEAWPLLSIKIAPLMQDCDGSLVSKETILNQLAAQTGTSPPFAEFFCPDLLARCPASEREEMLDFLKEKIEDLFTHLEGGHSPLFEEEAPFPPNPIQSPSLRIPTLNLSFANVPNAVTPETTAEET